MIRAVIKFIRKSSFQIIKQPLDEVCLPCWGYQEYDGTVRDLHWDKQIDVNNGISKHTFIQHFVVTHLQGIKLKRGNNSFDQLSRKSTF
ncbi:MAG: hypothetical protein JKX68_04920 [Flavobacteriales bacterium]|nr:hypothetical protein [Flavobacteriales bacterium]